MSTTTFYIVRHGETDWNKAGKLQGHADILLNDSGRSQAMELANHLADYSFSHCYSSDLKRAHHTAEIVLNKKPVEIKLETRLRERDFGAWEGKSWEEFRKDEEAYKQVESHEEIVERVTGCLTDILSVHAGNEILILTHGGIIHNLLVAFMKLDKRSAKVSVKNTGYVTLVHSFEGWSVKDLFNITITS